MISSARWHGKKVLSHAVFLFLVACDSFCGPYFFTATGHGPICNFDRFKDRLDAHILAGLRKLVAESGGDPDKVELERWTARSEAHRAIVMSRAKVPTDVAERVLAHTIQGIRGVYDRYAYLEEKRDALEGLAAQIDRIVNPPADNVVPIARKEISQVPG